MEKLLEILSTISPGVDFKTESNFVDKGILDSISIASLVVELCDEFDIEINVTELVPENFNTLEAMMNMIDRLKDEE